MIKVNLIKNGDQVIGLEVTGHANSAPHGKDLICAAVSSILTGGFNAFNENDMEECSLEEGYAKVIICSNNGQIILNTLIVQLKTIEMSYPKFIKIK